MPHSPSFRALRRALIAARRGGNAARLTPSVTRQELSRRRFLALFAAGAGLGLLGAPGRGLAVEPVAGPVAIIGAGLSGLSAALRLKDAGIEATIFEARDRVGGRIRSVAAPFDENLPVDLGAAFVNSDHAEIRSLCARFDVPLFENATGYAPETPVSAFLFGGENVSPAKLAEALSPLAQQIAADAALLDADWAKMGPQFDKLSVADYLIRHAALAPDPMIRLLIEKAIRTEYGVELAESSCLELLSILPTVDGEEVDVLGSSDEAYMIDGGTSRLVAALAQEVAGQIILDTPVAGISGINDGVEITLADGDRRAFAAVIVAAPMTLVRDMKIEAALPSAFRQFIAEARLGRNEKIIAGFDGRPWRDAKLFTAEAWSDSTFASVWEDTVRAPDSPTGALTFFHGGSEVDGALQGNRRKAARRRIETLEPFAPGALAAAKRDCARTSWSRDPWTRGAYSSLGPGQYTSFADFFWVQDDAGAPLNGAAFGPILFAGEHLSDAHYGYMNGAAETGRMAAQALLAAA